MFPSAAQWRAWADLDARAGTQGRDETRAADAAGRAALAAL
ncbi:MAG: hypothetical protein U1F30_05990 [Steroidobacteraceae bacterium]